MISGYALGIFILSTGAFAAVGRHWLTVLLCLWPVMGFADWTGWLLVEELDLLVCSCVAGWSIRRLVKTKGDLQRPANSAAQPSADLHISLAAKTAFLVLALLWFSAAISTSIVPIIADDRWFLQPSASYYTPQAVVRLLKPYFWVAILLILISVDFRSDARAAVNRLSFGMTGGLFLCALSVVWERVVYTGITDFRTDYRVTGPFWEMHVGGAALDAYLVLSIPFAVYWIFAIRQSVLTLIPISALGLGIYSIIVSFSRSTYLAAMVGLCVVFITLLKLRQRSVHTVTMVSNHDDQIEIFPLTLLFFFSLVGALVIFPMGGYQGVWSWIVICAVIPLTLRSHKALSSTHRRPQLLFSLFSCLLGAAVSWLIFSYLGSHSSYPVIFLGIGLCFLLLVVVGNEHGWRNFPFDISFCLWGGMVAASLSISLNWGAQNSVSMTWIAHVGLIIFCIGSASIGYWTRPAPIRSQIKSISFLFVIPALVGMATGGDYMRTRAMQSIEDLQTRLDHWGVILKIHQTAWGYWVGKGIGQFPFEYRLIMPQSKDWIRPGHHQVGVIDGHSAVKLFGSSPPQGDGQHHRLIQRLGSAPRQNAPVTMTFSAWAPDASVRLRLELCHRHLIYPVNCMDGGVTVPASREVAWVPYRVSLKSDGRMVDISSVNPVLALMVTSGSAPIWLKDVKLMEDQGEDLIVNGSFERGMERWFFTSDRSHLPWSAKNFGLHLWAEQGWLGVLMWAGVLAWLVVRRSLFNGYSKSHAAIGGAVFGVLTVGFADSLINHTRILGLILLMLSLASALRVTNSESGETRRVS